MQTHRKIIMVYYRKDERLDFSQLVKACLKIHKSAKFRMKPP
ncbi:MAG: hypothetical protein LBS62_05450 [Clostridiales bacterium]|nr:hypothetical protein [Clostridiales bacterium]